MFGYFLLRHDGGFLAGGCLPWNIESETYPASPHDRHRGFHVKKAPALKPMHKTRFR